MNLSQQSQLYTDFNLTVNVAVIDRDAYLWQAT